MKLHCYSLWFEFNSCFSTPACISTGILTGTTCDTSEGGRGNNSHAHFSWEGKAASEWLVINFGHILTGTSSCLNLEKSVYMKVRDIFFTLKNLIQMYLSIGYHLCDRRRKRRSTIQSSWRKIFSRGIFNTAPWSLCFGSSTIFNWLDAVSDTWNRNRNKDHKSCDSFGKYDS